MTMIIVILLLTALLLLDRLTRQQLLDTHDLDGSTWEPSGFSSYRR